MFTHISEDNLPKMVDVSDKEVTVREAQAECEIRLPKEVMKHFKENELQSKKGPVLHTAIIAGTMAVKKTHELIPFCHQINLEKIKFNIEKMESGLLIQCTVRCNGKTGVEMEALCGTQVAALTVYDMCKAFGQNMQITNGRLIKKRGGKSDYQID